MQRGAYVDIEGFESHFAYRSRILQENWKWNWQSAKRAIVLCKVVELMLL